MKPKPFLRHFFLGASALTLQLAHAADGTWTQTVAGPFTWSGVGNWSLGNVADGAGSTAFFTPNITANQTVTLDSPRIIGNITFTDSGNSSHNLTISGGNTLTLSVLSGTPVISVTQPNRQLNISSKVTGTQGLEKTGSGVLTLGNSTTDYKGSTTVTSGVLDFGPVNMNNLGGGAGVRDITVAAGAGVRQSTLTNAFLGRLVQTNDEITVMTGPGGPTANTNSIDFSGANGGLDLPKAFLGNYASNGAKVEYSGTLTPASDNYRLGGTLSSGLLGIRSTLSGSQGLIVGGTGATGIRVNLVAANDFTGTTVINSGAKLTIGNNLALQNSVLDVGAAGGNFALGGGTNGGRITGETTTSSPTFGGLQGSRNLSSVFTNGGGNNETNLAATAVIGFTLNTGAGVDASYSGAIGGFGSGASAALGGTGGEMTLTKTGEGKQTLSGTNTYTGATTVNAGTLEIGVGGSTNAASAVTVNNDAKLIVNGTVNGSLLAGANTTVSGFGTIAGGATLQGLHSPGNSAGIQSFPGGLTYSGANTTVEWELVANTTGGRGTNFDGIDVGGTLNFADPTAFDLVFNFTGSGVNWNDSFWDSSYSGTDGWLVYRGASSLTNFSNLSITPENWQDGLGQLFGDHLLGGGFGLHQEGNDIFLTFSSPPPTNAIPEPASALAICLLLGGGTFLRSRRRA